MTPLEELYNRLQNDPPFKKEFKDNPEAALIKAGIQLNSDDLAKIKARLHLDSSHNEKLDDRISK